MHRRTLTVAVGLASAIAGAPAAAQPPRAVLYRIPPLPQPDFKPSEVEPAALTDDGVVVGRGTFYATGLSGLSVDSSEAFRYAVGDGEATELGVFPGGFNFSMARAVTPDGSVICGNSYTTVSGPILQDRAFRWTAQTGKAQLPIIPGADPDSDTWSLAYALTADGSRVFGDCGTVSDQRWTLWPDTSTALEFPDSAHKVPGNVVSVSADGRTVFGQSGTANRAAIWRQGITGLLTLGFPGGQNSSAVAMSPDGLNFIGSADIIVSAKHYGHAFRYRLGGSIIDMGAPLSPTPQQYSLTVAVSGDGNTILGGTNTTDNGIAWIWRQSLPVVSLSDYFTLELGLDLRALGRLIPTAISPSGRYIAGYAEDPTARAAWIGWVVDTQPTCPADINADGFVDGTDSDLFNNAFEAADPVADFNRDGFVDGLDSDQFNNAFESGC